MTLLLFTVSETLQFYCQYYVYTAGNFNFLFFYFFIEVTLDYKALLLLLNKKDDEDFVLGGRGFDTECCAFCDAIRVLNSYQLHKLCLFVNSLKWF